MNTAELLGTRLRAQLIEGGDPTSPHDVVSHLLAVQAQDYAGATWAVGLRLPGSTLADVERAIAERAIVRTWPMRGTLHFVAAEDARWMLPLLAPRALARAATREAQLELDSPTFARSRELFESALAGGRRLSRPDAMAMLEAAGISTAGQRGYHILWRLAQEGLLVMGPMEGRQQTFALLDEWIPAEKNALGPHAAPEEALAHLAARYFAGHGPATVDDLARWADIPKRAASAALGAAAVVLESAEHDGVRYWFAPGAAEPPGGRPGGPSAHLLPAFDEYLIGYRSRVHQLGEHLEIYGSRVTANGMLSPTVVIGGRAVGVWKRTLATRSVRVRVEPFRTLTASERRGVASAAERFRQFLGLEDVAVEFA